MSLKLIAGPPNSGRTGAILEAFRAALPRNPVLVVPTSDDVERFEQRAHPRRRSPPWREGVHLRPALRARRRRPRGALPAATRPRAAAPGRRGGGLAGRALRLLAALARSRGFASALEELLSELQAARIDPSTFEHRARETRALRAGDRRSVHGLQRGVRRAGPRGPALAGRSGHHGTALASGRLGLPSRPALRIRRPHGRAARPGSRAVGRRRGDDRAPLRGSRRAHRRARRAVRSAARRRRRHDRAPPRPTPPTPAAAPCSSSSAASPGPGTSRSPTTAGCGCSLRPGSWPRPRRSAPRSRACWTATCPQERSRSWRATRRQPDRCCGGSSPGSRSRSRWRRTCPSPAP